MGIDLAFIWHPLCLISPANGIQDPFGCISAGVGSSSFIAELHDSHTRETTFAFANNVSLDAPNPVAGSNVTAILAEMVVSSTRVKTSSGDSPTKLDLTTCTFGAIAKVDPGAVKKGNTWGRDFPGLLFRVLGFGARQGVLQL